MSMREGIGCVDQTAQPVETLKMTAGGTSGRLVAI